MRAARDSPHRPSNIHNMTFILLRKQRHARRFRLVWGIGFYRCHLLVWDVVLFSWNGAYGACQHMAAAFSPSALQLPVHHQHTTHTHTAPWWKLSIRFYTFPSSPLSGAPAHNHLISPHHICQNISLAPAAPRSDSSNSPLAQTLFASPHRRDLEQKRSSGDAPESSATL